MKSRKSRRAGPQPWVSLWATALVSLVLQLWLCQFFSFGETVPLSLDINPSNLWKQAYHFPPTGTFQVLNWLGQAYLPAPLNPFTLAAGKLGPWWFFTAYVPVIGTCALLAMTAFLRELDLSRPAALFGGVVYAWQGDLLPFVYPGHYAYITTWPLFAIAAWAALRAERIRHWVYPLISGVGCGMMVGLQPDRGAIASMLITALYLAPLLRTPPMGATRGYFVTLRHFVLCVAVASLVALAPLLALFQSNVVGSSLGGTVDREDTYKLVTQFSLAPSETLTYLVPGFFGWHINSSTAMYWGWIGEWPDWPRTHQGSRNLNLAISTTGTIATILALVAVAVLVPGRLLGADTFSDRQRFFGRLLLILGAITLVLSWGWHTGFYRPLFALPLMDKWRNPLKWLEITNFALAVLAAIGLQHLFGSLGGYEPAAVALRRPLRRYLWIVTGLVGLAWVASYPLALMLNASLTADGFPEPATPLIVATMHESLLVAFVLLLLFSLLLHALWRPQRLRDWKLENPWLHGLWQRAFHPDSLAVTLAVALSAMVIVQMAWVADHFIIATPLSILQASNPLVDALKAEGNQVRASAASDDPMLNVLLQNQFAVAGISCLDISAASRIPDDLSTFFSTFESNRPRLWFLAGVKNVVVPENYLDQMRQQPDINAAILGATGFTLQPTPSPDIPSHAIIALKDYLAKATLVPEVESFPSDETLLKRLADPAWNPRSSILLSGPAPAAPPSSSASTTAAGPDDIYVRTYTPTDIRIEARSEKGGYVLINDQFDPDWAVQVNGEDAPLLRADYILRAVAVPAGSSVMTMHYASRYHVGGIVRFLTHGTGDDFAISAEAANNLSDFAMLAAWVVAGITLWRLRFEAAK